nr:MAG TPA: hypothetical protein [Caudoviricetes sp.]
MVMRFCRVVLFTDTVSQFTTSYFGVIRYDMTIIRRNVPLNYLCVHTGLLVCRFNIFREHIAALAVNYFSSFLHIRKDPYQYIKGDSFVFEECVMAEYFATGSVHLLDHCIAHQFILLVHVRPHRFGYAVNLRVDDFTAMLFQQGHIVVEHLETFAELHLDTFHRVIGLLRGADPEIILCHDCVLFSRFVRLLR